MITLKPNRSLLTGVQRKPTHTDQYFHWNKHHNLIADYSVINTLTHGTKAFCSSPQLLKLELQYLEEVLLGCKYPKWSTNRIHIKHSIQKKPVAKNKKTSEPSIRSKCNMVIPYTQGLFGNYKSIWYKHGALKSWKNLEEPHGII